jgi:hypothetical protein
MTQAANLPIEIEILIDEQVQYGDGQFSRERVNGETIYFIEGRTINEQKQTFFRTHESPDEFSVRVDVRILAAYSYDSDSGEIIADYTEQAREYAEVKSKEISEF